VNGGLRGLGRKSGEANLPHPISLEFRAFAEGDSPFQCSCDFSGWPALGEHLLPIEAAFDRVVDLEELDDMGSA
jgi:hypothetical protein